eukprot:TRINITY_DN4470_c0_g1_i2.p1 TRINITY_DN4470_c0_g1~~TRINITY_DN4470_c0_g1_i2.p1  ORF type:complete len:481 (+),score=61.94 TRINITY_DN4470_c0_g1_i2:51-1493(+)
MQRPASPNPHHTYFAHNYGTMDPQEPAPSEPPEPAFSARLSVNTESPLITPGEHPEQPKFQVTWKRWVQLGAFSFISICNAITWITFSPISDEVKDYWNVSITWVNMLSLVFMIAYVPFVFVASYALDHRGLRFGLLIGAFLTALGTWIRCVGKWNFYATFVGQTLCAIGQPFILNAPPKLAQNWFPDNQRTIATTISSVANPIGVGLGFLLPPLIVTEPSDIPVMLVAEAGLATAILLICSALLKDKPEFPPSLSATTTREENYGKSMKLLFTDKNFWVLLLEFGLGLGAFNTIATVVNQLVIPFHYSNDDSGNLGALFILCGLVGCGAAGPLVDKFRRYKLTLLICYFLAIGAGTMFALTLKPDNFALIAVACSLIGLVMTPVLPISLELACEISYPIGEATPSGFMMVSGQIVGIVATLVLDHLIQNKMEVISIWIITGLFGASFLIMFLFTGKLKRLDDEKLHKEAIRDAQVADLP